MAGCLYIGIFLSALVIYSKSVLFYTGIADIKEWKERAKFILLSVLGISFIWLIVLIAFMVALLPIMLLFGGEIDFEDTWYMLSSFFYICSCIFLTVGLPSLMTTVNSFVVIRKAQRENEKRIKEARNKIQLANGWINEDIKKLNLLRTNIVDAKYTKAICDLCKLIDAASNHSDASTQCLSFALKQEKILKAQRILEEKITNLAKQYEAIGDLESAEYYLKVVNGIK